MKNLRIQSVTEPASDNPRIDGIEAPLDPAVVPEGAEKLGTPAVVDAADLTADEIAKLSSDEAMALVASLVEASEKVAAEIAEDDEELAAAVMAAAKALKDAMAHDDEDIAPPDEDAVTEALRRVEAGRVFSQKNKSVIQSELKKAKAAIAVITKLIAQSAAATKAAKQEDEETADAADLKQCTECGAPLKPGDVRCPKCDAPVEGMKDGDEEADKEALAAIPEERHSEAVELGGIVEDADYDGIVIEATFCKAGWSKNVDARGVGRYYPPEVMKAVWARGEYDNKPVFPFHCSDQEARDYADGVATRRVGWTGPPGDNKDYASRWDEKDQAVKGYIFLSKEDYVKQARAELAKGFTIRQIFPGTSHDVRSKSKVTKRDGRDCREMADWRVVSQDMAQTPALGGITERQVAAGGDEHMDPNTTAPADSIAARVAELEEHKTKIADATKLAKLVGLADDSVRDFETWADTADELTPAAIEAKAKELSAPKAEAKPPKQSITRESREEPITAGEDKKDRLRDELIRFFDSKGYVERKRARDEGRAIRYGETKHPSERSHFRCYEDVVQTFVGDTYRESVGVRNAAQVLNASGMWDIHRESLDLRQSHDQEANRWATEDERDTECARLTEDDTRRYLSRHSIGDNRFQEALLTTGLTQLTGDVKHLVAMTTFGELQGGHSSLFPSSDIVVSETITVPEIGETRRHARRQKLTANAPAVAEGAAYAATTEPADEEESSSSGIPSKYGFELSVSIETMSRIPGIESELPTDIGEALDARDRRLAFNVLTDSTITLSSDSVAIFNAASHSNAVTTALSYDNVSALQADMRQQKAYAVGTGANQMGLPVVAKHLVVADELLNQCYELFSLGEDPRTGNRAASAIVNPRNPPLMIWSLPLLDYGSNADDYFLIADSSQSGVHLQARYLWSGQPQRAVFVANSDENGLKYSNDLVSMKGRLIVGYLPLDYRYWAGGIVP